MAAQLFYTGSSAGALADAGKGPVTDNTVTVGEILLRHAGFAKKMGLRMRPTWANPQPMGN